MITGLELGMMNCLISIGLLFGVQEIILLEEEKVFEKSQEDYRGIVKKLIIFIGVNTNRKMMIFLVKM